MWEPAWLTLVAFLWGATNPLMREGGRGIEEYILPFLVNQCGSVLFYLTLASAELSLAVPITNALTFLFTTLMGRIMGEDIGGKETYFGMILVVVGVTLCVYDKT